MCVYNIPFPKILTFNVKYLRKINNWNINWNNFSSHEQYIIIKKIKRIYENEWIKFHLENDSMDDY